MQILQSGGFWADIAFGEWIVLIALDRQHLFAIMLDDDTAHRFTQVAGPKVSLFTRCACVFAFIFTDTFNHSLTSLSLTLIPV